MNKPKLSYLSCDFDAYEDYDGKVMKVLSDFVRDHQNQNEIRHIIIQYLENVDSNSFAEMRQSLDDAGVILKYGDPRCVENEPERMEIDEVYFAVRN